MLSAATMAAVAATVARTMVAGRYDLQKPTTGRGAVGDVDTFATVAPGVAIRARPLRADDVAEGAGATERRDYRVGYPAKLDPAPRSGWRFVSVDGKNVLTVLAIEGDPLNDSPVAYAICARQEAR